MRRIRLVLAILAALPLGACETGTPQDDGRGAPPPTSAASARPPQPAPSASDAPPARAGEDIALQTQPVGLLECDELAAKYKACLEARVTGVARLSLQNSLEFTLKQWHAVQDRGGDAAALLQECQKTKETMRRLLAPYGCEI